MKGMIPLPDGIALPEDASTKPFSLSGMFLLRGDKLMALELDGKPVPCGESAEEEDDEEGEGKEEGGMGKEEGGCCGAYRHGEMCKDCPKQGGGFLIAIERAMKPTKRS
jgi:hypothetical protein